MKILLLGSGGREHAIARALLRDPSTEELLVAPGNPGIGQIARLVEVDILDPEAVAALVKAESVDFVVVGPEAPLVAGVADAVRAAGVPCFGPSAEAARLEGSKAYAKSIMAMADVPTAMARMCHSIDEVEDAIDSFGPPYVIKDDGLAAGKGVVVTSDREEALEHARECIAKHADPASPAVVVEEYLDGPEVSLFCLSDGRNIVPLQPAQDFKRIFDANEGPNTGGMGAYSPLPWAPEGLIDEVVERVAQPVVDEMARQGTPFVGLLYCGLALTSRGTRVIEFNVRFGDPETQVVLPRLRTPLGRILLAAATNGLANARLDWSPESAVTVVVAAKGYPGKVRKGDVISGLADADAIDGAHVIHAGTGVVGDEIVSAGGRVLCAVGMGEGVEAARATAYEAVSKIGLADSQHRSDIADPANFPVLTADEDDDED